MAAWGTSACFCRCWQHCCFSPSFLHSLCVSSHPLSSAQEPPVRVIHFLLLWLNRTSVSPSLSLQSGDIQQLVPQTVLKHLLKMLRQVSTRHTFFLSFQTSVVLLSLLCRSLYLSSACLSSFCLHLCLSVTLSFSTHSTTTHTHERTHTRTHTVLQAWLEAGIRNRINVHLNTSEYIYMCLCVWVHACVLVFACLHVCVRACML